MVFLAHYFIFWVVNVIFTVPIFAQVSFNITLMLVKNNASDNVYNKPIRIVLLFYPYFHLFVSKPKMPKDILTLL